MTKEWYVNMLVPDGHGKVKAKTLFIELGNKSEKEDVKEQLNRMGIEGDILSITESGPNGMAYSKKELKEMRNKKRLEA